MFKRASLIILILLICAGMTQAGSPLAEWKFDGNLNDSVGTNNGFAVGTGLSFVTDAQRGQVLQLDGTSWVEVASTNFAATNSAVTITAWIKADGTTPAWAGLVSYADAWETCQAGSSTWFGSMINGGGNGYYFNGSTNAFDGQWHFVAMTFDGTTMSDYVDHFVASTGPATPWASSTDPVRIGNMRANPAYTFKGKMDDVRVYSYALSASEIQSLRVSQYPPMLLAHWNFDGNYNDATGNANTGTPNGTGLSFVTDSARGQVLQLDGTSWVNVANTNFAATNSAVTITAWIKADGTTPAWAGIVTYGDTWETFQASDSGYFGAQIWPGYTFNGGVSAFDGQWHFVAMTYNGSLISVYVDQAAVATTSATPRAAGSVPVRIGNLYGLYSFKGKMDDVRIYNYALSAADVNSVANSSTPVIPKMLVAEYNFEGDCNDSSGNGNHATLIGGTSSNYVTGTGRPGKVLDLDGYTWAIVNNAIAFNFTTGMTITGWMKADGNDQVNWAMIVSKEGVNYGYSFARHYNKDWLGVYIQDRWVANGAGASSAGDPWSIGTWSAPADAPNPFDGQWHFIATTYDGSTLSSYIDNTVVSIPAIGPIPTNNDPLRIGTRGGGQELFGYLDDIKIYNYGLTPEEVFANICSCAKYDIYGSQTRNCKIDHADFSVVASQWGATGTSLSGDFNGDGAVNMNDLQEFAVHWLSSN